MKIGNRTFFVVVIAWAVAGCAPSRHAATGEPGQVLSFERFADTLRPDTLTATADCDSTCRKRRSELAYVAYVGKQIYCYWDLKRAETGTDFDQLEQSLEASIVSTTTASEYYRILRRWASAFHDGHVNAMLKPGDDGVAFYTAPIRLELLGPATDHERLIVVKVSEDVTEIAVGDEILAIDGVPAREAITQTAIVAASGSTERMRRASAARRLVEAVGIDEGMKPLELSVRSPDGKTRQVSLSRTINLAPRPAPLGLTAGQPDTGVQNLTARILPDGIGYLRIDAFSGSQDEFLLSQAMDRLADTRGLILDLRQNGGGDLSGDRVIERLAQTPVTRYRRSERLSDFVLSKAPEIFQYFKTPDASGLFASWHDLEVKPKGIRYDKPVVALIGAYCFSACDTFSASLKANHLATFVGEPTGGGTGTPVVFDLPISPVQFRYSVIRGQTPAGDWIEGHGTLPDVAISPTISDRVNRTDSQLQKALGVLKAQIVGTGPVKPLDITLKDLPPVLDQSLERAPSREENERLLLMGDRDER